MSLNIPLTKVKFIERFPELNKIYNWWTLLRNIKYKQNHFETDKEYLKSILGSKLYKDVISLYSKLMDFHNHIFKATEKHGRIYLPLHNMPKEFRACIKFQAPDNKFYNIKELFDLKCCFVQLSADIAKNQVDPNDPNKNQLINEFTRVKELAKKDIYTDILKHLNNPKLTRNDIKQHIMAWLFSTKAQRINNKNVVVQSINQYFNFKFPNFFKFINNYSLTKSQHKLKSNKNKHKIISKLSIDCFNFESELFFNNIFEELKKSNQGLFRNIYITT